jgi:putative flippase GtrA
MAFFNQFGKFVAVGFTNAAVDFGVLNLEISLSGISNGWEYSVFKSISFIVAVTHSYIWNKYWVFDAGSSGGGRSELIKFMAINVVAIIINVGIASFVVNYVEPIGGMDDKAWANVGAVIGSASAIFLTFIGSRLIVFKKKDAVPQI